MMSGVFRLFTQRRLSYSETLDIDNQNVSQQRPLIWPVHFRPRAQSPADLLTFSRLFSLLFFAGFFLFYLGEHRAVYWTSTSEWNDGISRLFYVSLFDINKYLWGEFACLAFRFNLILRKCASAAPTSVPLLLPYRLLRRLALYSALHTASGYDVLTITMFSWHKPGHPPTQYRRAVLWGWSGLQHNATVLLTSQRRRL